MHDSYGNKCLQCWRDHWPLVTTVSTEHQVWKSCQRRFAKFLLNKDKALAGPSLCTVKLQSIFDSCSAQRHGHGGHHHQDQKQGRRRQQTPEWVRRLDSYINVICSKFNDFLFDLKQQTYLGNISFSIWKSAVVVAKLYSYSGGPDNLDTSLCSELFTIELSIL